MNSKINIRSSRFMRIWLPLVVAAVAISIAIAASLRIPLMQALAAIALTAALALSGLLFRSFGKEDEP
ncbi:MAG: hypothetical protein M3O24_01745 [Thermoproteota archaeon]|nr:hypothetical protein [Thermoproteota archaeon]